MLDSEHLTYVPALGKSSASHPNKRRGEKKSRWLSQVRIHAVLQAHAGEANRTWQIRKPIRGRHGVEPPGSLPLYMCAAPAIVLHDSLILLSVSERDLLCDSAFHTPSRPGYGAQTCCQILIHMSPSWGFFLVLFWFFSPVS